MKIINRMLKLEKTIFFRSIAIFPFNRAVYDSSDFPAWRPFVPYAKHGSNIHARKIFFIAIGIKCLLATI
jgi:hypothetical protein